jgi:hypothetical protein
MLVLGSFILLIFKGLMIVYLMCVMIGLKWIKEPHRPLPQWVNLNEFEDNL